MLDALEKLLGRALEDPRQFCRFFLTGLLNSAFGFAVYSLCIYAGASYFLASSSAMVAGIFFNYRTVRRFVFDKNREGSIYAFAASYALVLACTVAILEIAGRLGANPYAAGLVVSVPMAVLSYFLQRRFVFSKVKDER